MNQRKTLHKFKLDLNEFQFFSSVNFYNFFGACSHPFYIFLHQNGSKPTKK